MNGIILSFFLFPAATAASTTASTYKRPYFCSQVCPFKSLPFRRILTSTVYPALPSVDFASARSSAQKYSATSRPPHKYVTLYFLAYLVA